VVIVAVTKEEGLEIIKDLVRKYEEILATDKSIYNEEQMKTEFINKFFIALGWDVHNDNGAAPDYKEVIFEDSIKVAGGTKAPDYCFRVGGRRIFFVEAKKPSINIKQDKSAAYQLRRYCWSAKLKLSILTDFEELALYGSQIKPKKTDNAGIDRLEMYVYSDYVDKWDEIYEIFSKDAVTKGKFDKYAKDNKRKRGTLEVDDSFLKELNKWRKKLARNIALRNSDINAKQLNFAVQQIIDRIIFLRMAEDRGIEPENQLYNLKNESDIYSGFCEICNTADDKYNSGLFHFKDEASRKTPPDKLTMHLKIDDGVWKEIIDDLYYPKSPFEFSVMPPEILGNAYEQFLGKIIRLTPGHQAKIEDKPEVKKAGGVYYTPQYIVDYIVEKTLGKLCKGKSPKKVSEIRILDPACGSGSFLLGAYNYLLKWHLDYYVNLDTTRLENKKIYKFKGDWALTIQEKKRILTQNIFGVDIDPQAVEVTKLSLLLRVLEGENKDVIEAQKKLYNERALPDLDDNIKCGNTLISPDIYDNYELVVNEDQIYRINDFDWFNEFKTIMDNDGFDLIIGNPPYISIQKLNSFYPQEVEYYQQKYHTASSNNVDIYVPFIERSLSHLLKHDGYLGFICPNRFFNSDYGNNLREFIQNYNLYHLVNFRHYLVFKKADTYTCLLFIQNSEQQKNLMYKEFRGLYNDEESYITHCLNNLKKSDGLFVLDTLKPDFMKENNWYFMTEEEKKVFDKIIQNDKFEKCYKEFFVGIQTSKDPVYILKYISETENDFRLYSKELDKNVNLEKGIVKPIIDNTNIGPYYVEPASEYVIFPYKVDGNQPELYSRKELMTLFPKTWEYLSENRKVLAGRENGRMKGPKWYAYVYPKNLKKQNLSKMLIPHVVKTAASAIDEEGAYCLDNVGANGIILKDCVKEHPYYFLAIINNPLTSFFISKTSIFLSGGYYATNKQFAGQIPIKCIDFSDSTKLNSYNRIVQWVGQLINRKKAYAKVKTQNDERMLKRQISTLNNQIQSEVYNLYGLKKKEISIIEKSINYQI